MRQANGRGQRSAICLADTSGPARKYRGPQEVMYRARPSATNVASRRHISLCASGDNLTRLAPR